MSIILPKDLSDQFGRIILSRSRKRFVQRLFWVISLSLLVFLGVAFTHIAGASLGELNPRHVVIAVLVTLALLVLLGGMVVHDAYRLWRSSREGLSGNRLQRRIFTMFCAVSVVPTLIITLFSVLFFNVGVNSWFDRQVSTTLASSLSVAQAYLLEHQNNIRNNAFGVANVIQPRLGVLNSNPRAFEKLLTLETNRRNLSEAIIFNRHGVLARTALSFSMVFERLPETVLERADAGDVTIISQDGDKIQGVLRIHQLPDIYLLITRTVDPTVIAHMQSARETSKHYALLQAQMNGIQLQFFIAFSMLALLMLFASIWAGMRLAARLIGPIAALNQATERVRAGDYAIRVPEGPAHDEIGNLARTFNRMTSQIEAQRGDLLDANRALDARRRFSETVLAGVSAGVLSLDEDLIINLSNRSAKQLLQLEEEGDLHDQRAIDILPDLASMLNKVRQKPEKPVSGDMVIERPRGNISLHVRVSAECENNKIVGYVVTFDDITPLVQAQRNAAWRDVAKRVAHEIKNPLTPIILSTERLKQKFAPEITSDKEAYLRYIDTISRHVRDIGLIVEEFVSFARLPNASLAPGVLQPLLKKVVFSEKTAHPEITYQLDMPDAPLGIMLDESLLSQALLNLLKNAAEAFESAKNIQTPCINVTLSLDAQSEMVVLKLQDNGPGFPTDKLSQLTEPYVTTRAKGTGLGLAIVKKTIEEHGGTLMLFNDHDIENKSEDVISNGAVVLIEFPLYTA
jgi:two-component system nitrogen regulation sensor histidine kinase NtrY